ncbi:MAG TPA: MBL fold metallo-hydrolase [Desulfurococcales archaeon]|nr:MBL fold metallo-hydrolase [Desulfurococcales archaeon]
MTEYSTPLLTITVLVDEKSRRKDVETCYGLSLLLSLDYDGKKYTLLFDVGPSWEILEYNMSCLGYNINDIDKIFITHWHRDHYGALLDLLESVSDRKKIKLYIPVRNKVSYEIERKYPDKVTIIVCNRWTPIAPLMKSTGPIGSSLEHALKVNLPGRGVVLVTGCSHAGLINIIKWSIESNEQLYTVIGGFHFKEKPLEEIERTLLFLEGMGVKYVIPLHDSNNYNLILDIVGDKFLDLGVGDSIVL